MRLRCWYCHKSVSTELPDDVLFRAIAACPECVAESPEAKNHPLNEPKEGGQHEEDYCRRGRRYV